MSAHIRIINRIRPPSYVRIRAVFSVYLRRPHGAVSVCQLSFAGKLGIGICLQKGEGISMPFSVSVQDRLHSKICVKVDRTLGRLLLVTKVSFVSF